MTLQADLLINSSLMVGVTFARLVVNNLNRFCVDSMDYLHKNCFDYFLHYLYCVQRPLLATFVTIFEIAVSIFYSFHSKCVVCLISLLSFVFEMLNSEISTSFQQLYKRSLDTP